MFLDDFEAIAGTHLRLLNEDTLYPNHRTTYESEIERQMRVHWWLVSTGNKTIEVSSHIIDYMNTSNEARLKPYEYLASQIKSAYENSTALNNIHPYAVNKVLRDFQEVSSRPEFVDDLSPHIKHNLAWLKERCRKRFEAPEGSKYLFEEYFMDEVSLETLNIAIEIATKK